MATAVQLRESSVQINVVDSKDIGIAALLVVALQRRPYRLDFLARILHANKSYASHDDSESIGEGQTIALEQAAKDCLDHNDFAFLIDGWGDIVFVFVDNQDSGPSDSDEARSKRIRNIFTFQESVYEDFQVDRTELIFSDRALSYVEADLRHRQGKSQFSVSTRVRLLENRSVGNINHIYKEAFRKAKPTDSKSGVDLKLHRLPGRMDFQVSYVLDQAAIPDDAIRIVLRNLSNSDAIDRIETTISYLEQKLGDDTTAQ